MRQTAFSTESNKFEAALADISQSVSEANLWISLALEDIRNSYRRSYLGLVWVLVSFAVFLGIKVLIFLPLGGGDVRSFAPYVALGFLAWSFIASAVGEGCSAVTGAQNWIKGGRIPYFVFFFKTVTRVSIITLLNSLVVIVTLIASGVRLTPAAFFLFPASLLFLINGLWAVMLLSMLSARFRDLSHLVSTIMRMMFFLTPIFWHPDRMGELAKYLMYNPFAHFLFIFRDPVLYGTIPFDSLSVVLAITAAGSLTAFLFFAYARAKIAFWV
ncbi:ABC transporter permease [Hyphococcus luteus]|uniref:ABC-2 type transporter transmembrane domain-containing protein n=1 Tax=Hyphococcus luteus TaxID=2058213 RepID=A0A2S7K7T2_9PROT|nr:ABC transporter permease [Marinicaulis flavus]PQA88556.1 hypothetical protein CW354_09750 [Marinicaulis flavus]